MEEEREREKDERLLGLDFHFLARNVYGTHTRACADLIYGEDVLAYAENCIRPMNREELRPILKFRAHVNFFCFRVFFPLCFRPLPSIFSVFPLALMARQLFETRSKGHEKRS